MIPFIKVVHTDEDGISTDLTQYVLNLQISQGAEAIKNTINLEFQNHDGRLNNQNFQIDKSSIIIHLDWNPITTQDPVISTTISSISYPMENNGKYKIKIKATDKTGLFLSKIWAEAITESFNWDAPTSIINLIGHLNDLESATATDLTTNNVALTKLDGSTFPKPIAISKIWKPGFEWLNELSQPEYTGEDRPYVYYVDANNDLHWHYPFQKPITTLSSNITFDATTIGVSSTTGYPSSGFIYIDEEVIYYTGKTSNSFTGCLRGSNFTNAVAHTSGTSVSGLYLYLGKQDIYKLSIDTTEDASYNFIIYNGGMTPAGYEYLDYTLDYAQVGKKFRMKFFDWKSEGKRMTSDEKARAEWGTDKTSNYPQPGGNPLGPSNTYTPLWTNTAVISNEEYHESFELELKKRCENKASSYFVTGKQKYVASCQMRGTLAYSINDLVVVVNPKFAQVQILRIKDIKHQINRSSWITDIELSEDPSALSTSS
jgi:hypothetical protein